MKYDDASWHYGGTFPDDLADAAGGTHAGMFVAWALLSGLGGEDIIDEMPDSVAPLESRSQTPGAFFLGYLDGKFCDDDLNEIGNAFAATYFDMKSGDFLEDYVAAAEVTIERVYYVPDTWETFDLIKPVIDKRFRDWMASRETPIVG